MVVRRNNKFSKGSTKKIDNDTRVMNKLRDDKTDPMGYLDKLYCQDCGRKIPDNRYHGSCQNCYFNKYDVTLRKYS